MMHWPALLRRALDTVALARSGPAKPATGLVAAVVVFDREDLAMPCISVADEEEIVGRLRAAVH